MVLLNDPASLSQLNKFKIMNVFSIDLKPDCSHILMKSVIPGCTRIHI